MAALRAGDGGEPRRMGVKATTVATMASPSAEIPANHHDAAWACRWPPEGLAVKRNTPRPAAMAAAANQSWRATP